MIMNAHNSNSLSIMTPCTPLASEVNKKVYMKYKARYAMNSNGYVTNFRAFWNDFAAYYALLTGDEMCCGKYKKVESRLNLMQYVSRDMCHGKMEKLWKAASRKHHPDKIERCADDTAVDIAKKIEKATTTIQLVNQAKDFFLEFLDFHNSTPINISYSFLYLIFKRHQRQCENTKYKSYNASSLDLLVDHYHKQQECDAKDDELETVSNKLRDVKAHEEILQQKIDAHNTETAEVQQRIQAMTEELMVLKGSDTVMTEELKRVTVLLEDRTGQVNNINIAIEEKNKELIAIHQEFDRMTTLLAERTQRIAHLVATVRCKEQQTVATHAQLTQANERVTQLDEVIETLRDQCDARNNQLESMVNQYNDIHNDIKEKDEHIKTLNNQCNDMQHDIKEKDDHVETLNTGLKRKTIQNANLKRKNTKLMKLEGKNIMGQSGNRYADNNVQQWREQMDEPVETDTRRQRSASTSAIAKRLRQNKAFYEKYRCGSWYNVTKFYKDLGVSQNTLSAWCRRNPNLVRRCDIPNNDWDLNNAVHSNTYLAKLSDFALVICNLAPKYKKTGSVLMNQLQLTTKDMDHPERFVEAFTRVYYTN
jgi:myosin heavy subunit